MEPATIIVTALALGAATGMKSVAEQAVKDGYQALKNLIKTKYPDVGVDRLEQKPDSEKRRGAVEEDITDAGAEKDIEILQKAESLLEKVENLPSENLPPIVDLEDITVAAINIKDIIAKKRAALKIKRAEIKGDMSLGNIIEGDQENSSPKL